MADGRRSSAALLLACLVLLVATGLRPARAAESDPLDLVRQRGTLVVGVKGDYPLFGQVGPDGQLEGMEVDLARNIAARLGVAAQLVAVTSANRLQRLEDGSVDLVIATLGDTMQRRELVTMLEPNYYASGVNLMVPPGSTIRDWAELRGRPVCATQGAYFNRLVAERYLVDLQIFGNNRDAKLAARAGRCAGWIYDDTAMAGDLLTPEWDGWRIALPSTLVTPWAIAMPRSARDSQLRRDVEDIIAGWHRSGYLIERERHWAIPPSEFLRRTHDLWRITGSGREPVCHRLANGRWSEECRNPALLTAVEATGLRRLGLIVKERTGLDFTIVYDSYDRASFLLGLLRTLALVAGSIIGAMLVGIGAAALIDRRLPVLTPLLQIALNLFRMTPPLLQIYVVFFGLGGWLAMRWALILDPMAAVLFCLSAYAGSAVAQALLQASAVLAGQAPGFRISRTTLGAALYAARGPVVGVLVNIAKATGMASIVAVPEVLSAGTAIMAERGNVTLMINLLMLTYFLIILFTVLLLGRLQRKLEASAAPPARQDG